jgi:hypothetical protein
MEPVLGRLTVFVDATNVDEVVAGFFVGVFHDDVAVLGE